MSTLTDVRVQCGFLLGRRVRVCALDSKDHGAWCSLPESGDEGRPRKRSRHFLTLLAGVSLSAVHLAPKKGTR